VNEFQRYHASASLQYCSCVTEASRSCAEISQSTRTTDSWGSSKRKQKCCFNRAMKAMTKAKADRRHW
jgi:hypothetical protein